jgi:hypothetical protein
MDIILDEEEKLDDDHLSSVCETALEYSIGKISLETPNFLKGNLDGLNSGWALVDIKTSKRGLLAVMIAPSSLDTCDRSVLAFWHINDPSNPYR